MSGETRKANKRSFTQGKNLEKIYLAVAEL